MKLIIRVLQRDSHYERDLLLMECADMQEEGLYAKGDGASLMGPPSIAWIHWAFTVTWLFLLNTGPGLAMGLVRRGHCPMSDLLSLR